MVYPLLNLYTSIHQVDFKKLLRGKNYIVLDGQIIFEKKGEVFITTIDENRNDFTAEDYLALPENAPFELINGKLYYMPSPFDNHQKVSINLSSFLNFYVKKNKLGIVRTAPFDVHFGDKNIYQPDILYISNERKAILKKFVYGAPDFIVEILSDGTKSKDFGEKKEIYETKNVLEYWVIEPDEETLEIFHNLNQKLVSIKKYTREDTATSIIIKGFTIDLVDIFDD